MPHSMLQKSDYLPYVSEMFLSSEWNNARHGQYIRAKGKEKNLVYLICPLDSCCTSDSDIPPNAAHGKLS